MGDHWPPRLDPVLRPVYTGEAWPGYGHLRLEYFARPISDIDSPGFAEARPPLRRLLSAWEDDGLGLGLGAWRSGPPPGWSEAVAKAAPEWLARADTAAEQLRAAAATPPDGESPQQAKPASYGSLFSQVKRKLSYRKNRRRWRGGDFSS